MTEDINKLKEINYELQYLLSLQEEKIKRLEGGIKNHQTEMQNTWANIDIEQTNKKLWGLL